MEREWLTDCFHYNADESCKYERPACIRGYQMPVKWFKGKICVFYEPSHPVNEDGTIIRPEAGEDEEE